MDFPEATLHDRHPCWREVPANDAWARPGNWSYCGDSEVPVEVDWLVRSDALAIGAPRFAGPALSCGCRPVTVYVNVQPSSDDAGTWVVPTELVAAVAAALRPADLDAYLRAPWRFPDFDVPALAITAVVSGGCNTRGAAPLSREDLLRGAVVQVARLLYTVYPIKPSAMRGL